MRYQKINRELFINNRSKFNQKTSDNSLTVFNLDDRNKSRRNYSHNCKN